MHRISQFALTCLAAIALLAAATPPQSVETAIEKQRALVASHPNDSAAQNDLGNLLRMSGQLRLAEDAYRAAIAADPLKTVPRYNLALLLQQQGKSRAALRELEGVVEIDPRHAWAHYQIGAIHESRGDDEGALAAYARAFALKPELASDKVNPQVIESKLSTRALLLANSDRAALTQAGSSYEDPARIAILLVPPLPSNATAEVEQPESANETAPVVTPPPTPAPRISKATEPAPPTARVLDEQSLDADRPTGQVRPSAGSAPSGNRSGGVRSTGGSRTWQQPGTGASAPRAQPTRPTAPGQPRVVAPSATGQPTVTQPGTPGAKQPQQPGYRPGTASTAWPQNRIYTPPPLPPNG
ncbi:MAG TPA: tetratricopeptide repeat protein [Thermoanaerobaculia bacterium]|nr:tetratricopeptide repeat protein [Thermoanaerobaculia bacterium]